MLYPLSYGAMQAMILASLAHAHRRQRPISQRLWHGATLGKWPRGGEDSSKVHGAESMSGYETSCRPGRTETGTRRQKPTGCLPSRPVRRESLELDLDVHARRQIETHQRVNRGRAGIEDVDEALVGAHLELLA